MVSEAEYDKNQMKMKAAQASTTDANLASTLGLGGQIPQTLPQEVMSLYFGTPEEKEAAAQRSFQRGAIGGATAGGLGVAGILGAGGAAVATGSSAAGGPALGGLAGNIGAATTATLSNKAIAILSGASIMNSVVAALMSMPNSIIGKEANKLASEMGIDVGNMRLLAFEQMYTTPVEDPITGQWTYLFDDETQLKTRMAEAGITKDLIENRVIQLHQLRAANAEIINQAGPLPTLRETGQLQPGELPFTGAQRINKEQIQQEEEFLKEQEAAKLGPFADVNKRNISQNALDVQTRLSQERAKGEKKVKFTPKAAQTLRDLEESMRREPGAPLQRLSTGAPTTPTATQSFASPKAPNTTPVGQPTAKQQFDATRAGYIWNPFKKQWEKR